MTAAADTAATAPDTPLLFTLEGGIATLCFNRPATLNALDVATALATRDAARRVAADPSVRAVVLKGTGKAFVAGGDLPTLQADPGRGAAELLGPLHDAVRLLHGQNAPVIAQVHGAAAGAGLSLMLQADFVLAAEGTRFNLAYINLGTSCDVGGSWFLPRMVGLRKALEIALLGDTLDAAEALRTGLVNRVLPAAELDAAVAELAARLAQGPTVAYGHMRRLMRDSFRHDLATQLDAEALAFDRCARTTDLTEGIDAFLAKRPARFLGR